MSDWVELDGYLINTNKFKYIDRVENRILLDSYPGEHRVITFNDYKEAQECYEKIKAKLIPKPKTIHNDYGPDNVSTPDDIAETNELESLRGAIEEIKRQIDWSKDVGLSSDSILNKNVVNKIEEIIKPFCQHGKNGSGNRQYWFD